jgi:hypothetical protein
MNSATACFAQAMPFGPLMSRYGPERSVSTPTLMIGASARAPHPSARHHSAGQRGSAREAHNASPLI